MKTHGVRNAKSAPRNASGYYFGLAPVKSVSFRLIVGVATAAVFSGVLSAQTFVTLHSFSQLDNGTNRDGAAPLSGLVLSSNVLYGTTSAGGAGGNGSLFKLNLDGSAFTTYYSFSAFASPSATTNADGSDPEGELVLAGGTVYGTASFGGSSGLGNGTVFKVGTDGTGFTTLYAFKGDTDVLDGEYPTSLILVGRRLYGTTITGGIGEGTLFAISSDGSDYTNLYNFNATGDGRTPNGLTLVDRTLYGTAIGGGTLQEGTVFSINPDGNEFASLYSFTNSTGSQPHAGLIISGDTFYGTTIAGGNIGDNDSGWGTIFSIKTNGTGHVILHAFSLPSRVGTIDQHMYSHSTNSDGASPTAALLLNGTTLYGTTYTGGNAGNGTIFAINTDGTGFTNLYSFSGLDLNTNWDGANPRAGLTISGGKLYGTTEDGGAAGNGTVFSLSLGPVNPPQLAIISAGANVVLTWTSTASGFTLQSTANLDSPVWSTNLPPPVVVNGNNTVANPISGTQQFFRLSQ